MGITDGLNAKNVKKAYIEHQNDVKIASRKFYYDQVSIASMTIDFFRNVDSAFITQYINLNLRSQTFHHLI